jgi:hypothetical protein
MRVKTHTFGHTIRSLTATTQMNPQACFFVHDVAQWYASSSFALLAIVLAIAPWTFRIAIGSRKLLTGELR